MWEAGVDGLSHLKLMDRVELAKNYGWSLDDKAAIITYHPETMSLTSPLEQVEQLIGVWMNIRAFHGYYSVKC